MGMERETDKRAPIVVCGVPEERLERYNLFWPEGWDVRYSNRTYTSEIVRDAEYLLIDSMDSVDASVLEAAPNLRVLHVEGVSFDKVDCAKAAELGICVCNNKDGNKSSVAELCVGLIIAGWKRITLLDSKIRHEGYGSAAEAFVDLKIGDLIGRRIGMIGMGAIGKEVVKRLQGWDCDLCYYDPYRLPQEVELEKKLTYLDFDELIRTSDVITIHLPVNPSTVGMIGQKQLEEMKGTAVLVNVARGSVVDDEALVWALENNQLGVAALDTVDPEPMPDDHILMQMSDAAKEKLILTPHAAGRTTDALKRMLEGCIRDFVLAEEGKMPNNIVNGVDKLRG
jgi:phosphoglycerate dehydrogenase-like enzyme